MERYNIEGAQRRLYQISRQLNNSLHYYSETLHDINFDHFANLPPTELEPERGYDFNLVNEGQNVSGLKCTICHLFLRETHSTPCHHAFCRGCLMKWNQQQPSNARGLKRCPSCNEHYDPKKIYVNGVVDRMVKNDIDVKCPQHEKECQWQGKIIDYKDHETKCDFVMVPCKNKGCNKSVARINMADHKSICHYQIVECEYCRKKTTKLEFGNHLCGECPLVNVKCPNEGCQSALVRQEIPEHLAEECLYEKIECEYFDVGCNQKVQRKDLDKHNKINLAKHQKFMLHDYKLMKMQLAEVCQSNKQLKDDLKKANENIEKLKPRNQNQLKPLLCGKKYRV
ncbi:TNF receptor-associated factor 5-like [Clytia hemisphaerica]|uniref:Uncharacterized protein n=1 Tax=Clytia hemisphaerica TaxID=252671 RepID=A0A7M5XCY3_9CNID